MMIFRERDNLCLSARVCLLSTLFLVSAPNFYFFLVLSFFITEFLFCSFV